MASALDALVGNETVKQSLLAAMQRGRLAHSILLCAEEGCGAGFAARCLAADFLYPGAPESPAAPAVLAGDSPELMVLAGSGASGEIRIDDVRSVRRKVYDTALSAAGRAVIVKGADRLNASSANALLKVIEEPPENVLFIFTAPSEASVLPTIRSRCCAYSLAPVTAQECRAYLAARFPAERELDALCRIFEGRIGSAVRVLGDAAERQALADARSLARAVARRDVYAAMQLLAKAERDRAASRRLLALFSSVFAASLAGGGELAPADAARGARQAARTDALLAANVNGKLALTCLAGALCAG